jgi:hypothetical protein
MDWVEQLHHDLAYAARRVSLMQDALNMCDGVMNPHAIREIETMAMSLAASVRVIEGHVARWILANRPNTERAFEEMVDMFEEFVTEASQRETEGPPTLPAPPHRPGDEDADRDADRGADREPDQRRVAEA